MGSQTSACSSQALPSTSPRAPGSHWISESSTLLSRQINKSDKPATKQPANVERPKRNPRILVFDIETSPNLVYTFGLFNQNISLEQVVKETSILSIAWKFLGEKETYYMSVDPNQADLWDDRELCEAISSLFQNVDACVTHNGDRFDLPVIRGRLYHHGLPQIPPINSIDTLVMAKQAGKHLSCKLAHLTKGLQFQKMSHAKFPGFALWRECLARNPEAWAEMERYNRMDILSGEALFERLRPFSKVHIPGFQTGELCCPKCGSKDLKKRGVLETRGGWYQRFKCSSCGGWSQSRITHRPRQIAKNILKGA